MSVRRDFFLRFRPSEPESVANDSSARDAVSWATDESTGQRVLIKEWKRSAQPDAIGLDALWRHEIRLLQTLSALPGGREYLIPLVSAGWDDAGYFLALGVGNQRSLTLARPSTNDVTSNSAARLLVWRNMERVARALAILHAHGVVHRHLTVASVFTSLGCEQADFRLGGFEWSIPLRHAVEVPEGMGGSDGEVMQRASFARDWQDFGVLLAALLGVDAVTLSPVDDPAQPQDGRHRRKQPGLNVAERRFLKDVLQPTGRWLDGATLAGRIRTISGDLAAPKAADSSARLYLIYDAARQGHLWKHVLGSAWNNAAATTSTLKSDLAQCTLLEVKQRAPLPNRLALRGSRFTYYLKSYGSDTWDLPRIDYIDRSNPHPRQVVRREKMAGELVEVRSPSANERGLSELKATALAWDSVFRSREQNLHFSELARDLYDAFVILHLIELLYQVAHVWKVRIQTVQPSGDGAFSFSAAIVPDEARTVLCRALAFGDSAERLIELLKSDIGAEGWQVSPPESEGKKGASDKWTFAGGEEEGSRRKSLRFTGTRRFNSGQVLTLRRLDDDGQETLMRRRTQLLYSLKEHAELTETLSHPIALAQSSFDPVPGSTPGLDPSKQEILREIYATTPLYLLQGPPGTGKSHLVAELVRRSLSDDSSVRLLITAQGHDALDQLMRRIRVALPSKFGSVQPFIVRSASTRGGEDVPEYRIKNQAIDVVERVIASELFQSAPSGIRGQIEQLKRHLGDSRGSRVPDKAFESLLLRSANVLFSTTNSPDLKALLDSRSLFDWTIVEEAGRATGTELLAPLMLSPRRLLIGDAKQLPSFGEETITQLLADTDRLQAAFETGLPLVRRAVRELDVDYLLERYASGDNIARLAARIKETLQLFASLYTIGMNRRDEHVIAGKLRWQFRMNPVNADLVSHVFYDDDIGTLPAFRDERAAHLRPFEFVRRARSLSAPVTFVSLPYAQTAVRSAGGEQLPAYHNPTEVDAVVEVLAALRARPIPGGKKPTLVVLTPYNEQLKRLTRRIRVEMKHRLSHLKAFRLREPLVHTIDSFQGDEAAVVVVSLVRNNSRGWYKGLGILGDARRVNVLLSRAQWTTILVGSLEFLSRRFPPGQTLPEDEPLRFLQRLTELFFQERKRPVSLRDIAVVPVRVLRRDRRR